MVVEGRTIVSSSTCSQQLKYQHLDHRTTRMRGFHHVVNLRSTLSTLRRTVSAMQINFMQLIFTFYTRPNLNWAQVRTCPMLSPSFVRSTWSYLSQIKNNYISNEHSSTRPEGRRTIHRIPATAARKTAILQKWLFLGGQDVCVSQI